MTFSAQAIFNSLIGQGATQQQATTLTGIAGAESGFGANTVSGLNNNGSRDYGIFQINNAAWPQYGGAGVNNLSLDQQSAAALHIYNTQGPTAWSTYNNGAYSNFTGGISGGSSIAGNNPILYSAQDPITGGSAFDDTSGLSGANVDSTFDNLDDDTFDGADSVLESDPATAVSGFNPSTVTSIGGANPSGAMGGGQPVDITDLPALDTSVKGAGTAVQQGATSAAQNIAGTFASGLNALQTYTSSAFVTLALVVMGVIFVAFGLGLFGKREIANII